MPERVERGDSIPIEAELTNHVGELTDPEEVFVDILNPGNLVVVSNAIPTRDSQGRYHYDYEVAADAPLGVWTARWSATIEGFPDEVNEYFEVLEPGGIVLPASDVAYLRLLLDDNEETPGGTALRVQLDDTSLTAILERHAYNVYVSAAVGWAIKAGAYVRKIDVSKEGNNTRPYRQLYLNAVRMAEHFQKLSGVAPGDISVNPLVGASRVVGQVISLREDFDTYEVQELVEPEEA